MLGLRRVVQLLFLKLIEITITNSITITSTKHLYSR